MVYNVSRLLYNISILVDTKYKCIKCVYINRYAI